MWEDEDEEDDYDGWEETAPAALDEDVGEAGELNFVETVHLHLNRAGMFLPLRDPLPAPFSPLPAPFSPLPALSYLLSPASVARGSNPILDASCCRHPLTDAPYLRPGPHAGAFSKTHTTQCDALFYHGGLGGQDPDGGGGGGRRRSEAWTVDQNLCLVLLARRHSNRVPAGSFGKRATPREEAMASVRHPELRNQHTGSKKQKTPRRTC